MDVYVFSKAGPGLYYLATSPPVCGQVEVKLAELPTNAEPPFKAKLIKARGATAVVQIQNFDLEEYLFQNLGHIIEREVSGGLLEGVVCDRKVRAKVASPVEGPILGVVLVQKIRKTIPPVVYTLYAYRLQLV